MTRRHDSQVLGKLAQDRVRQRMYSKKRHVDAIRECDVMRGTKVVHLYLIVLGFWIEWYV